MEQQTSVRGSLNVRLSSKGVDASTGYSDIAQEQLNDSARANDLGPERVVSPSQSVENAPGFVPHPGGGIHFVHFQPNLPQAYR